MLLLQPSVKYCMLLTQYKVILNELDSTPQLLFVLFYLFYIFKDIITFQITSNIIQTTKVIK